ncbi:MAG TPA: hypothetical protein VGV63_11375 [Acidimicrobiales bacterium]|nr:hypothetical protein [Acidimicrobiales bacterium]
MFVGEEPRLHDLDVRQPRRRQLGPKAGEHEWRDVDGDHSGTDPSHGQSELPRPGAEINDLTPLAEPVLEENCELASGVRILLVVVAGDVVRIQVLPACGCQLVE